MARTAVGLSSEMNLPRASVILRMVAFAVPAALAMAGVQPLVAAAAGSVRIGWAAGLAGPALAGSALVLGAGRLLDRGDSVQPPWYAAWLLLPGAFLLAGAAAMCIIGALVELAPVQLTMLVLLAAGGVLWLAALLLVRSYSH